MKLINYINLLYNKLTIQITKICAKNTFIINPEIAKCVLVSNR